MESRILFILSKYIPLVMLFIGYNYTDMRGLTFGLFALTIGFIYWPIIDYYRLKVIGFLTQEDFWKCFNPFFRLKFYGPVVFGTRK